MTTFVRDFHGFWNNSSKSNSVHHLLTPYKSRSLICPDTTECSLVLEHPSRSSTPISCDGVWQRQTVGGTYIPRRIRARSVEQEEGGKMRECPRNRTPADTYGMDQNTAARKDRRSAESHRPVGQELTPRNGAAHILWVT